MFPKHNKSNIGEPLQMSCRNSWEAYTLPAPILCESTLSRSHVTQVSADGHTLDIHEMSWLDNQIIFGQ